MPTQSRSPEFDLWRKPPDLLSRLSSRLSEGRDDSRPCRRGRLRHEARQQARLSVMRKIAILFAAAAACFAQTAPAEKPGLTLHTTTTLVQVNVLAHDAKGRAVTDLKQEDFEVFDNGEKRKIAKFAAETAETAIAPPQAAAPTAFPEDKPAPPEHDHGYAVVVLDYMNSGKMSAGWAKTQVEKLLKQFDPAGKAALYMFDDDGVTELGDFRHGPRGDVRQDGQAVRHSQRLPGWLRRQ